MNWIYLKTTPQIAAELTHVLLFVKSVIISPDSFFQSKRFFHQIKMAQLYHIIYPETHF